MDLLFLSDYLEKAASSFPDKEAIIYKNKRISYGEFLTNVRNLAKSFLEMGVKKGDRIAVLMPNCPEYLYTYMASSLVGAVVVGINPLYKGPEIAYILNNSLPKVMVMIDEHRQINYQKMIREYIFPGIIPFLVLHNTQHKKPIIRKTYLLDDLIYNDNGIKDERLDERKKLISPDDGILVIYTSGTTGKPKGAVLTHNNIISTISEEVREWEFSTEDRVLLHLHISHIGGASELFIAALMKSAAVIIMDHFNPVDALELIQKEKVTFLGQVPTMFTMMLNVTEFPKYDLSSIRMCAVAGAPTPPDLMMKLFTIGKGNVRTAYGLAETSGLVTYTHPDDSPEKLMETVGRPTKGFSIKIVDGDRAELPDGETGEVAIKGNGVIKEYFELPAETEKVIDKDGWFFTGDIGMKDKEGYLKLIGRKKDMINTGGFTVYPLEIENKLMKHPLIQLAAVCGVPNPVLGETGRAYIVTRDGNTLKHSEVISFLEKHLAEFKIPEQFVFRKSLPLTLTGKVEKRVLQEEIANEG